MSGTRCDGSARQDAPDRVEIDSTDDTDRWRYVCPNGHHNKTIPSKRKNPPKTSRNARIAAK